MDLESATTNVCTTNPENHKLYATGKNKKIISNKNFYSNTFCDFLEKI
jgi:hypothetical protein